MTQIPILHLMNAVSDSSIGRIIQRLVSNLGQDAYRWHVAGISGPSDMHEEFGRLGVQIIDFSDPQHGSKNLSTKIRDYIFAHDVKIVHTHSPRTRLAIAMALRGMPNVAHLATEHLLYAPRDRRWGLIYALLDRITLFPADHVVAVSNRMKRQLSAMPGLSDRRITAIQNAIDCEYYYAPEQREACRLELGFSPVNQVIGYAGRLDRVKRLDLLIRGFSEIVAKYPEARLLIVGVGDQRPHLEALVANLGISHAVVWTGFRRDMPRLLAAMDIYIQSSVNEGLSLAILEAMVADKPIIATDVGGAKEVLEHEKTGYLINPGSSNDIRVAIDTMLNHPEKRAALADAARDHVLREFGMEKMVEGYRKIYESLA